MEVDPGLKQGYVDQEVGHETEMHTEIKKNCLLSVIKHLLFFYFCR